MKPTTDNDLRLCDENYTVQKWQRMCDRHVAEAVNAAEAAKQDRLTAGRLAAAEFEESFPADKAVRPMSEAEFERIQKSHDSYCREAGAAGERFGISWARENATYPTLLRAASACYGSRDENLAELQRVLEEDHGWPLAELEEETSQFDEDPAGEFECGFLGGISTIYGEFSEKYSELMKRMRDQYRKRRAAAEDELYSAKGAAAA